MLHKLDTYLLDRLDTVTAMLQKRGLARLTSIHVGVAAVQLVSNLVLARDMPFFLILGGAIFGLSLLGHQIWAHENRDYPENHRETVALNAEAVASRDHIGQRMFWLFSLALFLPIDLSSQRFGEAALTIAVLGSGTVKTYLDGCLFLGPGEFARQKKESLQALPSEI